jgi:dihydroorotate dehydrogenase (fumarate)
MADLSSKYLGIDLKNPIIVGSSGLSESVEGVKEIEKHGAGAVVLKSLFEEEIIREMEESKYKMNRPGHIYPEIFDFFDIADVEDSVSKYLYLIEQSKKSVSIPVIASVNCVSSEEWPQFAKRFQDAGADALELNLFILPSDFVRTSQENEKTYFDIVSKVQKEITIPVSLKISYYFSNLAQMIMQLSQTGIKGLVLFNRFYNPDIDINSMIAKPGNLYSSPEDISLSLRWIAIMAGRVGCDLAASTGVHDGAGVIKQLLAGANAVQVVSTLYKNGLKHLEEIVLDLDTWMNKKRYNNISDFRGILSQANIMNPAAFERVQFMKYFSGK